MNHNMFCSEVELGGFLGSVDIIPNVYDKILKTSLTWELHSDPSGFQVLAFNCPPVYTSRFLNGEFDLVSSRNLQVNDFISTQVNPSFSINEAAPTLLQPLFIELSSLKDKVIYKPLVVTGQSLGGYMAILFSLWLQHVIDVEDSNGSKGTIRPICITFGSPFIGDQALQNAIFERPQWKSCFLNVVAKMDLVPRFLLSNRAYKSFGTYLVCTESGGFASFDDHDSILEVLDAMGDGNSMHNYGNDLSLIKRNVLYRGVSELGESNFNSLRMGIMLQLLELGVVNNNSHILIDKMEAKQTKMIKNKRNVYEPTKKLNDMKISLTYMEWYIKAGRSKGGYYDYYKYAKSREEIESQQEIVKHKRRLNQYWKYLVKEKDQMPQKEGAKLRKRWLYGGTNYRRIVEPLDIAEHYKRGGKNYLAARPSHYELLEKMLMEDNKESGPSDPRNKAASLTEDSCFWAYVEEAMICLKESKDGGNGAKNVELVKFEGVVMRLIDDYALSPDVFLEGSSFMKWGMEYKTDDSRLAEYMNNERYKSYK